MGQPTSALEQQAITINFRWLAAATYGEPRGRSGSGQAQALKNAVQEVPGRDGRAARRCTCAWVALV